jgi:predicted SAM-dependent methyltransferase/glycosyltransferase involved in cell wall biosynthesis
MNQVRVLISDGGRHRISSGYGHVARLFALALFRNECFHVQLVKTEQDWEYEGVENAEISAIPQVVDDCNSDIVLQIGSPRSFKRNFRKPSLFFTLCDLSDSSPQDIKAMEGASGILTASKNSKQVFEQYFSQVYLTPLSVNHTVFRPMPHWRQEGLDQFTFMFVGSFSFRKGVDLLIQAFFEEFSPQEAHLKLHCPGANPERTVDFIKKALKVKTLPKNMSLSTQYTTSAWLNRYYNRVDAFVSLTRGEGWGLPIAEAMLCELPVIAPLSTSMLDYLNDEVAFCLPTQKKLISEITDNFGKNFKRHDGLGIGYFEVDLPESRKAMRAVFDDTNKYFSIGKNARKHLINNFSFERFSRSVYEAIIDFVNSVNSNEHLTNQSSKSNQNTRISTDKPKEEIYKTDIQTLKNLSIKKLEIGAGSKPRPGYLHHDIRPLEDIEIICDAKKFPDHLYETFDEVYSSNVLEHFNRFEVNKVLKEWTKLVRPGGLIEIIVPDLREISRQFTEGYIDFDFFNYLNFGGNDYEYNVHKFGFDVDVLEKMLKALHFEVISSQPGVRWEDRKIDRYCPMARIKAKKLAPQVFRFAGHTFDFFYHQGNCGFPPEPRTERTVEIPIAEKWLSLAGKDVWEIGAVTCNYFQPLRVKRIIDPYDKNRYVTDRKSMMDIDFYGQKILSISTIEHIGHSSYEGKREDESIVLKALDKIFNESPCFLITYPALYNPLLDQRVFNNDLPKDVKVRFLVRELNQNWKEVDHREEAKRPYGKTRKSNGVSAGADAIIVLERGGLLQLPCSTLKLAVPPLEDGKVYLHLGGGDIQHPKFINIDARPAAPINYVREIDDLSIFSDESVDLIYASHCLEHFSHQKVHQVLSEWYRVLKKGSILRLSVPDFDVIVKIYQDNSKNINTILGKLMGGQDYEYNFHKTAFNRSSLESVLKRVGFNQVREWRHGECDLTSFPDSSRSKVSLNLEAMK